MKNLILFALLVSGLSASAGDVKGNGGGLWTCQLPDKTFTQAMLVDSFEARVQLDLKLKSFPQQMPPQDIADLVMLQVEKDLPTYSALWADSLKLIRSRLHFVDGGGLVIIDDGLFELTPDTPCAGGAWTYAQFANYNWLDQVLISSKFWNSPFVSNFDKAGLMIHEAIYLWLRTSYQDTNSLRARYITGVLLAEKSAAEKVKMISAVLQGPPPSARQDWFCELRSPIDDKVYGIFGANEFETRSSTTIACQQGKYPTFCRDSEISCEKIVTDHLAWTCTATNTYSGLLYLSRGRGRLEAEFRAITNCEMGTAPAHGCFSQPPVCQPLN